MYKNQVCFQDELWPTRAQLIYRSSPKSCSRTTYLQIELSQAELNAKLLMSDLAHWSPTNMRMRQIQHIHYFLCFYMILPIIKGQSKEINFCTKSYKMFHFYTRKKKAQTPPHAYKCLKQIDIKKMVQHAWIQNSIRT